MAVYGFLSKGPASPAVQVSISKDNDSVNARRMLSQPRFWDNYPVLVLKTYEERLSQQALLEAGAQITITPDVYRSVFFRCHFGSLKTDSLTAVQVLKAIQEIHPDIIVLLDQESRKYLNRMGIGSFGSASYVLDKDLPLTIEGYGVSYFFRLRREFKLDDILIPRTEIPEVMEKYLREEKIEFTQSR
jgi:hypothetical protein